MQEILKLGNVDNDRCSDVVSLLHTQRFRFLKSNFYFTSPQPIKPKEASDSDFTIEDVMLWPGMRFSLRSQWKRYSAGRLHNMTLLYLLALITAHICEKCKDQL